MGLRVASPDPDDSELLAVAKPEAPRDQGKSSPSWDTTRWIYFAILLALALGTRLYQLDVLPYGHNNDETRMAIDGYLMLQEGQYEPLLFQSRESTFPYLYGLGVKIFGFSNGIIRLPSAFLGVVGAMCLCGLLFRILPDGWAFAVGLAVVSYGPYVALDRLALRTSICTAAVFAFLLLFFVLRSSDRRLHWFLIGLVFGLGFHTYNAYRAMPIVVFILFVIHFWDANERKYLFRKAGFFILGALVGGANMVYIVLTESPKKYLWREADLLGLAAGSDIGFLGMVGRNLVELFTMLRGFHIPLPLGAAVPYFHIIWLPFLLFGLYAIIRSKPRSPEFALLVTLLVFLLPVLLTDEFFARRFLTSLVLIVVVTGIGFVHAMRWVAMDQMRLVRGAAVVLAGGVALVNVWSYFVGYASMPRTDDHYGPFYSTHRFFGPIVRDHATPDTRIIFSDEVEDPWMITIHLTGIIDRSFDDPAAFWRIPHFFDGSDVEEVTQLCADEVPVMVLFRMEARGGLVEDVMEMCGTHEFVEVEWPEDILVHPEHKMVLAKRTTLPVGAPTATEEQAD